LHANEKTGCGSVSGNGVSQIKASALGLKAFAGGHLKLASGTIQTTLWTSPEAKAGMPRAYFGQVHRKTVTGTILMGRGRALVDQERVFRVQEIAIRSAVMDEATRYPAGVGGAICVRIRLARFHSGMVFKAKRAHFVWLRKSKHENCLSRDLKRGRGEI
jgi:hypothetical protein